MYLVTISNRGIQPTETATGQGEFADISVVFDTYSAARQFAENHSDANELPAQVWALKSTCEPIRKIVWSEYAGSGNPDVRMAS